ncbi:mechanosensitive ion channel family protein [Luteolibacter luteus]|uniref:Mechanosensitive ion channel n=1 Tax=Luteolibacter luteus TaxID=2728835 RepID=A0A858RH85_9BACT|nr:mechanosensitive ion channel domain-containing protein [Luteolibacter luteus]QJE95630.1 mechanosensitive ion channel [Luteolibacter luteus]
MAMGKEERDWHRGVMGSPAAQGSVRIPLCVTTCVSHLIRFLLLAVLLSTAPAQIPGFKLPDTKTAEVKEETAAERKKRLKSSLEEWSAQVEALDKEVSPPPGITPEEIAGRRSDLLLGIFMAENTLRSLDTAETLQQSLAQAKQGNAEWKGFEKPGPYSFTLHDELRRQQEGIDTRLRAYESAVTMFDRELAKRQDEIKKADEAVRRAQETVDRAAADQMDAAAWRLAAAKLKLRVLGSAAGMIQLTIDNTYLRSTTANAEAELLKRKVTALGTLTAFPEEDIAQLKKSTDARRKEINKELAEIERIQNTTIAARQTAMAKRDALKVSMPADADEKAKAALAEAEARLQIFDSQLESLANRIEITGARMRFLNEYLDAQLSRKTLLTAHSAVEGAEALGNLQAQLGRASAFDSLVNVRRSATLSAIQEQEQKLTALDAASPLRQPTGQLMAALRSDLDAVERFGQDISGLHQDIGRWLGDSEQVTRSMTWGERMQGLGSRVKGWGKKVRDFVVYPYDVRTEVDGRIEITKRGLTLGWLVTALFFFWIAYRASSWLVKRAFGRLVTKGRVQQGQADTLRRWTRIALGVVLALVTLHFLKIPLTAFAFLGGALAIGVGFGTQTLFKNFISGLIVLAERNVRVGDILEVDGVAGTVKVIDTRSSIVRSFDGVDMIVPNSVLLENKVINWTHGTSVVRRVVRVRVPHGSSLRMVSTILGECATEHGVILKSPEPQVLLEDFATDALVFAVFFWIDLRAKTGGSTVASDLRFMIERRLGEAGISLATPQQPSNPTPKA